MSGTSGDKSFQKPFAWPRASNSKYQFKTLGSGYILTPDLRLLTFAPAKFGNTQTYRNKGLLSLREHGVHLLSYDHSNPTSAMI